MSIIDVMDMEYKGFEGSIKKIEYPRKLIKEFNRDYKDMSLRSWWYCGYIHVPATIDIRKVKDRIDDIFHGGITYEEHRAKYSILGFDCNHANDTDTHNTIDFVKGIIEEAIDYLDNIDEGDLHD